jgi:peptidyl-prolyl cis-trans isomerase C
VRRLTPLLAPLALVSMTGALSTLLSPIDAARAQARPSIDGGWSPGRLPWQIDASTPDILGTSVQVTSVAAPTTAIATGRGVVVTAAELVDRVRDTNELEQRRFAADPAALEQLADRIIADRLLANEARRRGLENDPAVRAALERALIARLRATVLNPTADAQRVTDQEVRAFYESNAYRFHIPERRRVAVLFTTDLARLQRETRRWARLNRVELRRAFRELTRSLTTDEDLIRADYELYDVTESRDDLDEGLRRAAFALRNEGDVSPEPVPGQLRGRRGYWMVRLIDRRVAIDRTLEESADWIRGRIAAERRLQVERETVQRLSEQAALRRVPAASVVRVQVVTDAGNIDAGL